MNQNLLKHLHFLNKVPAQLILNVHRWSLTTKNKQIDYNVSTLTIGWICWFFPFVNPFGIIIQFYGPLQIIPCQPLVKNYVVIINNNFNNSLPMISNSYYMLLLCSPNKHSNVFPGGYRWWFSHNNHNIPRIHLFYFLGRCVKSKYISYPSQYSQNL